VGASSIQRMAPYGVHDLIDKGSVDGLDAAIETAQSAPLFDSAGLNTEAEFQRLIKLNR